MAQALFQKVNEPKRLYLAQGAGHNDMISVGGQPLFEHLSAFLQTLR
jgi:succinylarginine dihydrolase